MPVAPLHRSLPVLSPLVASFGLWALCSSAGAQGPAPLPGTLSQRIAAKLEASALPGAPTLAFLERGVRADHPHSEDLALYAPAALDAATLAELAARGVRVVPGLFIPAMPGRHPFGFHLANVPHGELAYVCAHPALRGVRSAELPLIALDDTAKTMLGFDAIAAGECVFPRNGEGIKIGLADSGYDHTSLDLPTPVEAFDVTDGDTLETWGTDLSGPFSGHGTHVAGVMVGNGFYSNGLYAGAANAAELYVYKTTNDLDGTNWSADLIKAIHRAVDQGVRIFNLSIGTYNDFNDGSDPLEQAVDWAREQGMLVVVAAGNEAQTFGHTTFSLAPGESSPVFQYLVPNFLPEIGNISHSLQVIWRDGLASDPNIRLEAIGLDITDSLGEEYYALSPRGTESKRYLLETEVAPLSQKTISLQLFNDALEGDAVDVHVFRVLGLGALQPAVAASTVMSPGLADLALCVGAWTSKESYTDASGNLNAIPTAVFDTLASFSSHGPRLDGAQKPDLCAPGVSIISVLSASASVAPSSLVDNDGVFGEGDANYSVRNGTSFAAPMVCAAAALLAETAPHLDADALEAALLATCANELSPDNQAGAGLFNAQAALIDVSGAGCGSLIPSEQWFSVEAGGQVDFRIEAGPEHAGRLYIVLGTTSGIDPGTPIDAFNLLPLNFDSYLQETLMCSGAFPLTLNCGILDPQGQGAARFELPGGLDPIIVGKVVHHAALVVEYEQDASWIELISNTVRLELIP
jgi:subtilisin family serine protease